MDYSSQNSQSALCYAQHAIDETLHQLTCARHFLTTQIERQMLINDAKRRLNNPFIEERNIEPLGIFSINTPNIIDFLNMSLKYQETRIGIYVIATDLLLKENPFKTTIN